MFTQTWKKYLPAIMILIKRSVKDPQFLNMNHTDFERAAGGRKIKYSFSHLILKKGKINSEVKHAALAKELAQVLQEDDLAKRLIASHQLEFSLNNEFQLSIKNITPPAEDSNEQEESEMTVDAEANPVAEMTAEEA